MLRVRTLPVVALAVVAGSLAIALPAFAAAPQPVTITVYTDLNAYENTFAASGPVCASGTVTGTLPAHFNGWQSNRQIQILVGKHFICPDGTFDVWLHITFDFQTGTGAGTWYVHSGTDAYAHLHGSGTITGTDLSDTLVLDVYTGSMTNE